MEAFFDLMVVAIVILLILAILFVIISGYLHHEQDKLNVEKKTIMDQVRMPLYQYYLFGKALPEDLVFDSQLKLDILIELNEAIINNFENESLGGRMTHLTQFTAGDYIYKLVASRSHEKQDYGLSLIRKFHLTEVYYRLKREGYLEKKNHSLASKLLLQSHFESQTFLDEFLAKASLISVSEKSYLLENISAASFNLLIDSFNQLTKTKKIILIKATGNRIDSPPLNFLVRVVQEEDLDMKYYALKTLDKYISLDYLTDILDTRYFLGVKSKDLLTTNEHTIELKEEL